MKEKKNQSTKVYLSSKDLAAIDLRQLPRVGEKQSQILGKLGLKTIFDLLYYLPRRYEDRCLVCSVDSLEVDSIATIGGFIVKVEEHAIRRNNSILRVEIKNGTNFFSAVWFNQAFLKRFLRPGMFLTVTGKVKKNLFDWEIAVIDYETGNPKVPVHTGRIVPIYGLTADLSQRFFRRLMFECVKRYSILVKETLFPEVIKDYRLFSLSEALFQVHFPHSEESLQRARERLVFEELFLFQSGLLGLHECLCKIGVSRFLQTDLPQQFLKILPYKLTSDQLKVIDEIKRDLAAPSRMFRLLQGDVGCGKTFVALYALFYVIASGYQGALMAPTEVLADQHYLSLQSFATSLGVNIGLLTGSLSKKEREKTLTDLALGRIDILVGTHALLQDNVEFQNLGLIVIDEQHRFGVRQRDLLLKKEPTADVLIMTATPIPRSLALTVYGDLNLSLIKEMPPGRKEVKTYFLPIDQKDRVYQFLLKELHAGRQAYVVCPLIEESEKIDLEAAVVRSKELAKQFPAYHVALLHGKMKIEEKEEVMADFRRGKTHLLVATSVIEVGIDVPNSTIIIIEGAERFGLAQLHQLRGRVGRGLTQGYCILIGNPQTDEARERLKVLCKNYDGFCIAEKDLCLRGPGELMGTRQHGFSDFRVVDIFRDAPLLEKTREAAYNFRDYRNHILDEIAYRFPLLKNGIKF